MNPFSPQRQLTCLPFVLILAPLFCLAGGAEGPGNAAIAGSNPTPVLENLSWKCSRNVISMPIPSGRNSPVVLQTQPLHTRIFRINVHELTPVLERLIGPKAGPPPTVESRSPAELWPEFFRRHGVDLQPPKSLYAKKETLLIRASLAELDRIETALQELQASATAAAAARGSKMQGKPSVTPVTPMLTDEAEKAKQQNK